MNWQATKDISAAQIGAWLALLIVLCSPNYGIEKYGPSPAVPAFLLALVGMWLVWRERDAVFALRAQRRWLTAFALLLLPVLVSIPGSYNPRTSWGTAAGLLLYGFAGIALVHALRERARRDWLIKWTTAAVLFWLVDACIQLAFGRDLFGIEMSPDFRVLGPFAGNLHLSLLVVFLLPMVLTSLLPRGWTATLIVFALAGVIAMLSGSRAALFFLVVVAAGLFTRLPGGRRKWLLAAAVLAVGGVAIALSPVLERRFGLFSELLHPSFESMNRLLSYRLWIWDTALNMVADRPFRGVGAGAFQAAYDHYSNYPGDIFHGGGAIRAFHAHQLYVGLAAETGLLGLVAFGAILVLALHWYRRATPAQRLGAWPFGLGLLVYVFPVNSQPVLYTQWLFPVIVLLLTGMLASLDEPALGETPANKV